MALLHRFVKQPWEKKDYDIDYSPWLDDMEDQLVDVMVFVDVEDYDTNPLRIVAVHQTRERVKIWLDGGMDGERYKVTIQVFTEGGRTDESELSFRIKDF